LPLSKVKKDDKWGMSATSIKCQFRIEQANLSEYLL
jgi:hypothetical protein